MKLRMRKSKVGIVLLSLLLLCVLFPLAAFARGTIDTRRTASLTAKYPCADVEFRLYKVAEVDEYGHYTLTGAFVNYSVDLSQTDQKGWNALALTLEGYAAKDNLEPEHRIKTDSDGAFTLDDLPLGLYLVSWDQHTAQSYTYSPVPFLVSLPELDTQGEWTYTVSAEPKYERKDSPQTPPSERPDEEQPGTYVSLRVEKVWQDNNTALRPESVQIQLLRNGEEWRAVTLDKSNNWSFTWEQLDAGYRWQVVEQFVPDNYFVSVWQSGDTFVVTNTSRGYDPSAAAGTDMAANGNGAALPQTGVLWWPVPLLVAGGLLLFLFGWLRHKSGEKDA